MSNITYNNLWADARATLTEAANADTFLQNDIPHSDKTTFHNTISEIYYKYIIAANKLDECYDQIVHPQKRRLVRNLLDGCLGRLIELKNDLVNVDISEFSYNDDALIKIGISPMEAEIAVPKYFRREREEEINYKKQFIEDTLRSLGYVEEEVFKIQLTELEAIKIIQIHERARQGRLRGQFMKEIRLLKEKGKPDGQRGKEEINLVSALMIQRMWRGFITRRNIRKRKMDEMYLIGMIPPTPTESSVLKKADVVKDYRHRIQEKHEKDYLEALDTVENSIKDKKGAVIMEEITEEVRHWFKEYKDHSGKFPEFPSEENGGSRMMFSRQGTESEVSKSTAISSKESKKSKDKDKGKKSKSAEGKTKEVPEADFNGYKTAPTIFLPNIMTANEEYEDIWRFKDESDNAEQKHNEDMIYTEKYRKVESEIRKVVDEIMRNELELLQIALDKDKAHKGKKSKKASKKKARKGGKKAKKKKEKDLTPDRTTESLFEELVSNGIIKKYPEVPIDSFIGEKSFAAFELRKLGKHPLPCLGDIRQVIKEYCIIPMGSDIIHQSTPLIRSILISGPHGSGKKMLVNAVCTELGAIMFDLTPANIVGKYPGKTGLIMLTHLVNKVSRLLQPSIIFMDGAEKPFVKKIPKTDKTDPKRLKKDLPKLIKGLTLEDRVMFIGTSYCPWDADQKLLQQTFQKYIQIPRPDYGSVSFLWTMQLNQYSGIGPHFDISPIAKMSDGYTVGEILKVIKSVITTKRMLQLRVHPLTHAELIMALSKHEPVYKEEDEAAEQWWWKTPLGKKKIKALEMEEEMRREIEEQNSKNK